MTDVLGHNAERDVAPVSVWDSLWRSDMRPEVGTRRPSDWKRVVLGATWNLLVLRCEADTFAANGPGGPITEAPLRRTDVS